MKTNKEFEGIVVDDASVDKSAEIIRERFGDVRLAVNKRNLGFAETINAGVKLAKGEIIVLVNNDIVASQDFFTEILKPFEAPQMVNELFGVSAKTVNWDTGEPNHLNMTAHFSGGEVRLDFDDSKTLVETFFIQGGAGAYRRDLFMKLGGFSKIFHPGYWEDYDISYLAMKMGYKCLYQPSAIAHHYGKGSLMTVLGKEGLNLTIERNKYIFTWLNITDSDLIFKHFISLPFNISKSIIRTGSLFQFKAALKALRRLPDILRIRGTRISGMKFVKKDKEILG